MGSTKSGDVIFWQIDIDGKVRTGKIMQYDPPQASGYRMQAVPLTGCTTS